MDKIDLAKLVWDSTKNVQIVILSAIVDKMNEFVDVLNKIGSNPVRDGKPVGKNVVVSPEGTLVKEKPQPIEPFSGSWINYLGVKVVNETNCKIEVSGDTIKILPADSIEIKDTGISFQVGMDPEEEKAKIISNIVELTANINSRINNTAPQTDVDYICGKTQIIKKLLGKL